MALIANIVSGPEARRLLLLAHGFGADERDLGGLLPYLDPEGAYATVMPRAPLAAPGTPGFAWYEFGDPEGYLTALGLLDEFVDEQAAALDKPRGEAILAGFSQGGGLALGLGMLPGESDRPAGVLAMSPAVPSELEITDDAKRVPVLIQHGTNDPLIAVQRSRDLARQLRVAGVPTVYREYPMQHQVAMESIQDARDWMNQIVAGEQPDEPVPEDPVELVPAMTTARFDAEVLQSDVPVIVDFWAPWCGPCRQVSPVVETIAAMRQGSYKVVKVNIDEEPKIAEEYGVQSIPMIGLFRNGRMERASVGAKPRPQIEAELGMLVIP